MRASLEAEVVRRTGGGHDDWAVKVCLTCVQGGTAHRPRNFLITGAYRGVRDRVVLLDVNALASATIEDINREAREWLRTLPTADPSR